MKVHNCLDCKCKGFPLHSIKKFKVPEDHYFLFELRGSYFCLPCLWLREGICLHCGEKAEKLVKEDRCKANPWVCQDCYTQRVTHKYECYSSGCMTPEEFAKEAQDSLEDGEFDDDVIYFDNDGEEE